MAKARRGALPKDPKNVNELNALMETPHVRENYGKTKRHEPKEGEAPKSEKTAFFRYAFECNDFSYCIFAAEDIVSIMETKTVRSERTLFADGTFKICPVGQFNQVLILFFDIYGHVSTCFFICVPIHFIDF